MWTHQHHQTGESESKTLGWKDFPAKHPNRESLLEESTVPLITAYLRRILETYEDSEFIKYLVMPSPTALSGFFHCEESDIYSALKELARQGYEYELSGHADGTSSGPITLWDPLVRRKPVRIEEPAPWQIFCQALFNPARRQVAS